MNRYKKFGPLKVLFFLLAATGFIILVGNIIMLLWNAILPELTGVKPITFWQSVGLFILSKILFGGWHRGMRTSHRNHRHEWKEKWQHMSEEDRAQFKARWRAKCGPKRTMNDELMDNG